MAGMMALGLFLAIGLALMAGFPVAFTLAGVALLFAGLGILFGLSPQERRRAVALLRPGD